MKTIYPIIILAKALRAHIKMRIECVARGLAVLQGARNGEYPLWIFHRRATQQQRQRSAIRRAVFWPDARSRHGGIAPEPESALSTHGGILRRALSAARQKSARPFLISIWALLSLAPSIPSGSPVVGGPAVVAIHAMSQTETNPITVRTNVVKGVTNVTTMTKYATTNFTMNAGSLLALLKNSFHTNFDPGAQLLLQYDGGGFYSFIVSDKSGTNFGFDPGSVLSTSIPGGDVSYGVASGVQTVTVTNGPDYFGKVVASTTTLLNFTYDDSAMTTNTTDHQNTKFFWTGLIRSKFSASIPSGFQTGTTTIDIMGYGLLDGGTNAVFTGSIQAKVTGTL